MVLGKGQCGFGRVGGVNQSLSLATDKVERILKRFESRSKAIYDKKQPCRNPAPFGKGAEKDSATEDDSTPSLYKQKAKIKC